MGAIVALGLGLRFLLLWLATPIDLQSDEANYVYLGLVAERFGLIVDQDRYLWPPGYPWLVGKALAGFGIEGLGALRVFQILLSGVIGGTTMLLGWRLFSTRAAAIAGLLWAVHLPLGAFTHLLWTETVFLSLMLPAIWQLLRAMDAQDEHGPRAGTARLLISGLLFGVALHFKEMPVYLVPLLGLVVFVRSFLAARARGDQGPFLAALPGALLVPMMAFVVTLPWTLRNHEVYGRTVMAGATLGENMYVGMNARYMNFDMLPLRKQRGARDLTPIGLIHRKSFLAPVELNEVAAEMGFDPESVSVSADLRSISDKFGWPRAEEAVNTVERQSIQFHRGVNYALANPGWALRTRVKKLSDAVTPLSFFTRHQAVRAYPEGGALSGGLRMPSVLLALFTSLATMVLGAAGYFLTLPGGAGRQLITTVGGYLMLTSLIVAMSRFRVPFEPFLIVMSAGFLSHGLRERTPLRLAGLVGTFLTLAGLWWVSYPETWEAAKMAMGVE